MIVVTNSLSEDKLLQLIGKYLSMKAKCEVFADYKNVYKVFTVLAKLQRLNQRLVFRFEINPNESNNRVFPTLRVYIRRVRKLNQEQSLLRATVLAKAKANFVSKDEEVKHIRKLLGFVLKSLENRECVRLEGIGQACRIVVYVFSVVLTKFDKLQYEYDFEVNGEKPKFSVTMRRYGI